VPIVESCTKSTSMKTIADIRRFRSGVSATASFFALFCMAAMQGFAQTSNRSEATNDAIYQESREQPWYAQPWIWAIVIALVILIVAFAMRGNRRADERSEDGVRSQQ
jgi:hypothetical protein